MFFQVVEGLALCPIVWVMLKVPDPSPAFFPDDDLDRVHSTNLILLSSDRPDGFSTPLGRRYGVRATPPRAAESRSSFWMVTVGLGFAGGTGRP